MNDLGETLNAIFKSGKSIRFQNVVKRKDGEWYTRIIWEEVQLPRGQHIRSCDWWGFDTIEEAANNCLNYILIEQV